MGNCCPKASEEQVVLTSGGKRVQTFQGQVCKIKRRERSIALLLVEWRVVSSKKLDQKNNALFYFYSRHLLHYRVNAWEQETKPNIKIK